MASFSTSESVSEKGLLQKESTLKIALVHDWLTGIRGGEKVLAAISELTGPCDLFTLLHVPDRISGIIADHNIHTSFLQKLPFSKEYYRYYLPFFPAAIESFNLSPYDLVLSTSHAVAKGVLSRSDALHISYIHTPMRYVWELFWEYFGEHKHSTLYRLAVTVAARRLREWDVISASRADHYLANSHHVRKRIMHHWRREAEVVYPPVDTEHFTLGKHQGDYFLVVSSLVPYKRIDLAVGAANQLKLKLIVVGDGPEKDRLQKMAGSTIEFIGALDNYQLNELYGNAKALLFPGEEDFGIVPVEAMATGTPVIAYGRGGAMETVVIPERAKKEMLPVTGIGFMEPSIDSLVSAIRKFETFEWDVEEIRKIALNFDKSKFLKRYASAVISRWILHGGVASDLPKNFLVAAEHSGKWQDVN
ncbi:MAG: glycosyltransferase [bacterium]|nr:glycosyltransferase [bacterium]